MLSKIFFQIMNNRRRSKERHGSRPRTQRSKTHRRAAQNKPADLNDLHVWIIDRRTGQNKNFEYLLTDGSAKEWLTEEQIGHSFQKLYGDFLIQKRTKQGFPQIIQVLYIFQKAETKIAKVQTCGSNQLLDMEFDEVRTHAPDLLLDYLITLYK